MCNRIGETLCYGAEEDTEGRKTGVAEYEREGHKIWWEQLLGQSAIFISLIHEHAQSHFERF